MNLFLRNIIWALVIFVLCSVPGDSLPQTSMIQIPHFDKMVHFGLFFIMGIFLIAELRYQTKLTRVSIAFITFAVIAFAREDKNFVKGSARSIPGVHIRDLLEAISTVKPGLIEKFGGHAMAAG